jgi:cell division protein FtsI/penicillin-binding protein 2
MTKQWWARVLVGRTAVADPLAETERPDARFELEWRGVIKGRLLVMLAVLAIWVIGLEVRLFIVQVVDHQAYAELANRQHQDVKDVDAIRGDVRDRNGQLLAYSVESFDVLANPSAVKDVKREAAELCRAFGDCSAADLAEITDKFSRKKMKELVVRTARDLTPDAAMGVRALLAARAEAVRNKKESAIAALPAPHAVWLEHRSVRYYPKMTVAAHVVGFVKADGQGGAGIESRYDTRISGVKGRMLALLDGRPNEMLTRVERMPVPGASMELTIDTRLQQIVERELEAGVRASGAQGGAAIIQDPLTGEILAEASYPLFNPNSPSQFSDEERRNRAVQNLYEPGSTFKIVTASAALNEHVWSASDVIDTNPGTISFGSRVIHEDKGKNYHVLSFEDVIVKSSNVGVVKIGLRVGADRMMQYVKRFGFGQKIAADIAGENPGILTPLAKLTDSAIASMSMGHQVGVTPIQMASAASVVANGGLLMEPHIVRAWIHDGIREEVAPRVLRRVIEPETAATVTSIMESVVTSPFGTGHEARLTRYQVAGKTGTAEKAERGGYSKTDYNVSFVGFVPSRKPVFTILVVVDSPSVGPKYGGRVAAPIFRRIAEAALQYTGVAPTINPTAPVIVLSDRPLLQPPPRPETPVVTLVGGRPVMPDVRGLTLRDALRVTTALGLTMTSDGDGVVVTQTPAPGEFLAGFGRGAIQLRRTIIRAGGDR